MTDIDLCHATKWATLIDATEAVARAPEEMLDAELDALSDERLNAQRAVTASGSVGADILAKLIAGGEDVTLDMLSCLAKGDCAAAA